MSEYTSASSVLHSEVPKRFFSSSKEYVFTMLDAWKEDSSRQWKDYMQGVQKWTPEVIEAEASKFTQAVSKVERNLKYTVLLCVKSSMTAEGNSAVNVPQDILSTISVAEFFGDFVRRLVGNSDVKNSKKYDRLSPSDKNILAEDSFRSSIYKIADEVASKCMPNSVVSRRSAASSRRAPAASTASSRRQPQRQPSVAASRRSRLSAGGNPPTAAPLQADDSVSCAPSEIISQIPREGLNATILEMHRNSTVAEQQGNPAPEITLDITAGSKRSASVRQSRAAAGSRVGSRVPSKFSRSPPQQKKREELPCFFESVTSRKEVEIDSTIPRL